MKELWKSIRGYKGLYEVSNLGRVRSLDRYVNGWNGKKQRRGKILSLNITKCGYGLAHLSKNSKRRKISVHSLVYGAFCGRVVSGMQIDHIDNDKLNNRIDNLQLLSPRQNIIKSRLTKDSKYPLGVCYRKDRNHFYAHIKINGKQTYLGSYNNPELASQAYQNKLNELLNIKEI